MGMSVTQGCSIEGLAKEWYQGCMKKYTVLVSQRKKIAEEYERCVSVSSVVIEVCKLCLVVWVATTPLQNLPAADRSVKALLKAIRVLRNERRRSKNGTPAERDSSRNKSTPSDSDM